MKRVTNCILLKDDMVLMLQKPRRGWWVVPGGKIEPTETIQEAVIREFREETNLEIKNPSLRGVFNIIIKEGNKILEEWMLFTFFATDCSGILTPNSREGNLKWYNINDVLGLPKAEGDNVYFKHLLYTDKIITGKFIYTADYKLISYYLDKQNILLT